MDGVEAIFSLRLRTLWEITSAGQEKGGKKKRKKRDRLPFLSGFRRSFLEPHNHPVQLTWKSLPTFQAADLGP